MTDTLLLEIAILKARLTKKEVARRLGLSVMAFYEKSHNITEFRASEINKLYTILNLSSLEEQQRIFFNRQVDSKSTSGQ